MASKHVGGTFDDFLKEEGIYEEVTAIAKAKAKHVKIEKLSGFPPQGAVKYRHQYSILHDTAQNLSVMAHEFIQQKDYKKAARLFRIAAKYEAKAVSVILNLPRTKKILESSLAAIKFKAGKYAAIAKKTTEKKRKK